MKKVLFFLLGLPSLACAEWVPIITSADFTGIKGDVGTAVAGIISILLIIVGVGLLMKVFR